MAAFIPPLLLGLRQATPWAVRKLSPLFTKGVQTAFHPATGAGYGVYSVLKDIDATKGDPLTGEHLTELGMNILPMDKLPGGKKVVQKMTGKSKKPDDWDYHKELEDAQAGRSGKTMEDVDFEHDVRSVKSSFDPDNDFSLVNNHKHNMGYYKKQLDQADNPYIDDVEKHWNDMDILEKTGYSDVANRKISLAKTKNKALADLHEERYNLSKKYSKMMNESFDGLPNAEKQQVMDALSYINLEDGGAEGFEMLAEMMDESTDLGEIKMIAEEMGNRLSGMKDAWNEIDTVLKAGRR